MTDIIRLLIGTAVLSAIAASVALVGKLPLEKYSIQLIVGIISASAIVTAAIITAGTNAAMSIWKERRERTRVATLLCLEISRQTRAALDATRALSAHRGLSAALDDPPQVSIGPSPAVYLALTDKLLLLPTEPASSVAVFYSTLERAKTSQATLDRVTTSGRKLGLNADKVSAQEAAYECWKETVYYGARALIELRPLSQKQERLMDVLFDKYITELEEAAEQPVRHLA